jgi:hypothetical protein
MSFSFHVPKTLRVIDAGGNAWRFYPAPILGKDAGFIVRQCRAIYGLRRGKGDETVFVETPSMRPR